MFKGGEGECSEKEFAEDGPRILKVTVQFGRPVSGG